MANGLLAPAMPNVANPQQSAMDLQEQMARQQGFATSGQGQQTPGMQQAPGYLNPGSINELYGILAQGTQNPQQLGASYTSAMQNQQAQDRANLPIERYMQLYGKINPHDYSPQSIRRFHQHFVATGEMRHDFLEERQRLSSTEEKAILEAHKEMQTAGSAIGTIGNLSDRFEQAAVNGTYKSGLYGSLDKWYKANVSGKQTDMDALKTEYNGLKNKIVIESLPPGVASDRDIAIAREGWPPDNADPAHIAAFLRGVRKMQVIAYSQAMHKSNYLSSQQSPRGLTQDWQDKSSLYVNEALQRNGLRLHNVDQSISNKDAAIMYMQSLTGGTPMQGTQGDVTRATPGLLDDAKQSQDFDTASDAVIDSLLRQ